MNREAFKLARDTLRRAVKDYGFRRNRPPGWPQHGYTYGPGKFQGEHWSIVHWYDAMMNGGGDEPFYEGETCVADVFEVSDVERAAFMLRSTAAFAVLWHSSNGFESLQYVEAGEYDKLRAEYETETEE